MARRAPRREHVTVAELLVRTTAPHDPGTRARHREKPQVLRSLARLRVVSVVAGALALTGGVGAAVSMPVERGAGASWPPVGLEPPPIALIPLPADVAVPSPRGAAESVAPSVKPAEVSPGTATPNSNSGISPGYRGTLARAVKVVGKVKPKPQPRHAAPVRHEIPDVPVWSRGRAPAPDRQAAWTGRHRGGGHHECGGGGRHRR
ncbi:hypothetical protein H4696_008564 [Amycolatopsis lexingtonensis]|uniref:Uncharacterized protein n=1 Tax=Amycolatopsis lexingtonensis TaxID=218822 RepID=A0ABR9IE67_9PSEU|nr:hypothetical protein [Amycolatopsis lexingtonensis]MBE1501464.1 hypothetical protein [Amycolatopsis lexingtonensis]